MRLGLEISLAAEELEITIFDPLSADQLVRDSARVFEKMQLNRVGRPGWPFSA